jgi:hypothetical protein
VFFRQKRSGSRTYLQIVENRWEGGKTRQRVLVTLGRVDQLQETGRLEALLASGARFCRPTSLPGAQNRGRTPKT